jgi:hypothetical protein
MIGRLDSPEGKLVVLWAFGSRRIFWPEYDKLGKAAAPRKHKCGVFGSTYQSNLCGLLEIQENA